MRVPAILLVACCILSGCRTNGPQICIRDSHGIRIAIDGDSKAAQGKSVTGEVSPAVSAGVTAQVDGNAVSQSGDATATPTGDNNASADAAAADDKQPAQDDKQPAAEDTDPQGDPPVAPNTDSEPGTPNSEPGTPNSEPGTPNSEPGTPNSEPGTPNSELAAE